MSTFIDNPEIPAVEDSPENPPAKDPLTFGLILEHIPADKAAKLLQELDKFDEAEQRDTLAYLKCALDEDRLSDRKLFSS